MTPVYLLFSLLLPISTAPATPPVFASETVSATASTDRPSPVEWLGEMTVDLGEVAHGEDVTHVFRFRNLTERPLTVANVRAGCGCTATDWSEQPVAPGAVGTINVTYDSMNDGFFRKYVRVYFDEHRGGHKLWLEGFVDR